MNLEIQWLTLGVMLATGVGMGLLFDSYRVVWEYFKAPRWSLSVMDMLYWIISAVVVFRMLYVSNNGEVRGYVFIGLAFGVIVYALILSKPYAALILYCIKIIRRTIHVLIRIIDTIFIKPVKILFKIAIYCVKIGSKFTITLIEIVLKLLIPILKVLFWPFKPLLLLIGSIVKKHAEQTLFPHLRRWELLQRGRTKLTRWYEAIKRWIYS